MRAVALLVMVSLSAAACFPHNEKYQTYAKLTEGGLVAAGVGLLFFVNTGADCDLMSRPGQPENDCHTRAAVLGDIGLGLILTGLVGFIATISTAEDAKPDKITITPKEDTVTTPKSEPTAEPKATQKIAVPPPASTPAS